MFVLTARMLNLVLWSLLLHGICQLPLLVSGSSNGSSAISSINGVYNSSTTPLSFPWNTYNYCNAPHVNAPHYSRPNATGAKLVYLNAMVRHHKRTPDNLYPDEAALNPPSGWNCENFLQFSYGGGTANVYHETFIPSTHPFLSQIWNGTCDEGQLTQAGLEDAVKHGQDFWSVYHNTLGFLTNVNPQDLYIRTSTETRTFQVAGGLLFGMDPASARRTPFAVYTEPANIDSLVPDYDCPLADNIRDAYQSVPAWTEHLDRNSELQTRLCATTGTTGLSAWTSWYDHFFDTFSSRTCHGYPLPCNSTGTCVSEEDAATVFSIGDFEYNYIWNAAANASTYTKLTFGVMFSELAQNFRAFQAGQEKFLARLYVGHDGSMIRLASGLGLGKYAPLRWPAMGSEIIMEVWRTSEPKLFVRILHEGTPVEELSWLPLDDFVDLLESQAPENLYETCMSST